MNDCPSAELAAWIASTRTEKNLSQARLAQKIGVTQAQISQWETGKQRPNDKHIEKLRAILGKVRRSETLPPKRSIDAPPVTKTTAKASEPPASRRTSAGRLVSCADQQRFSWRSSTLKRVLADISENA